MKQAERKDKKGGKKGEAEEEEKKEPENTGIHPARLAMMSAPAHRQRY
jgi:nucleolar protein 6